MNCPYCAHFDSKVIDSREINDGIRRRRQCLRCSSRFTTYERLQPASLFVIKKDQRREEFRRDKLLSGIRKACEKRPLPSGTVEKLGDEPKALMTSVGIMISTFFILNNFEFPFTIANQNLVIFILGILFGAVSYTVLLEIFENY